MLALATDFPRLWHDPATPQRARQRMVPLLIEYVTLLRLTRWSPTFASEAAQFTPSGYPGPGQQRNCIGELHSRLRALPPARNATGRTLIWCRQDRTGPKPGDGWSQVPLSCPGTPIDLGRLSGPLPLTRRQEKVVHQSPVRLQRYRALAAIPGIYQPVVGEAPQRVCSSGLTAASLLMAIPASLAISAYVEIDIT